MVSLQHQATSHEDEESKQDERGGHPPDRSNDLRPDGDALNAESFLLFLERILSLRTASASQKRRNGHSAAPLRGLGDLGDGWRV